MSTYKASVLVVDDDSPLRLSLAMVLTAVGYQVRSAVDGFAALAHMRTEVPDVLISDLNMSGMDGFELLKVVRRRFPSVRVIAMSGKFAGEDMPVGVVADNFHGKGGSLLMLLKQVSAMVSCGRAGAASGVCFRADYFASGAAGGIGYVGSYLPGVYATGIVSFSEGGK